MASFEVTAYMNEKIGRELNVFYLCFPVSLHYTVFIIALKMCRGLLQV